MWNLAWIACVSPDEPGSAGLDGEPVNPTEPVVPGDPTEPATPVDCTTQPPEILSALTGPDSDADHLAPLDEEIVGFYGLQGGWHVWVGASVRLPASDVAFRVTLTDEANGEPLTNEEEPPIYVASVGWSPDTCEARIGAVEARLQPPTDDLLAVQGCMRVGHGIGIDIDLADLVSGVEAATFTTSASLVLDSNSEQVACAP